jgi:transcriptional regulator with XRE-family HTH domain
MTTMSSATTVHELLGEFLRARRAERSPEEVGLERATRPRRVAGLRREEVAQLASISVDYYTRLEQGRVPPPSSEVLEAIARAIRLDGHERVYLRELAARAHEPAREALPPERVAAQTQAILDSITTPALVLGRLMDVLAWNAAGAAFFVDFADVPRAKRNLVRLLFADEQMRARFPDWQSSARVAAAMLRMRAAHCPHDPRLAEIVAELSPLDEDFRRWWTSHHVLTHSNARRTYWHPDAGTLELEWCELTASIQPDVAIVVLTPADADSARALERIRMGCDGA